ncbi:hypothetical protein MTO96_044686 [Rhipicephalus appendiculatus]
MPRSPRSPSWRADFAFSAAQHRLDVGEEWDSSFLGGRRWPAPEIEKKWSMSFPKLYRLCAISKWLRNAELTTACKNEVSHFEDAAGSLPTGSPNA